MGKVKNKKRMLAIGLAFSMAVSFGGCGAQSAGKEEAVSGEQADEDTEASAQEEDGEGMEAQ